MSKRIVLKGPYSKTDVLTATLLYVSGRNDDTANLVKLLDSGVTDVTTIASNSTYKKLAKLIWILMLPIQTEGVKLTDIKVNELASNTYEVLL